MKKYIALLLCLLIPVAASMPFTALAAQERIYFEDFNSITPVTAESTAEQKQAAFPASGMKREGKGYQTVPESYSYVVEDGGRKYLDIKCMASTDVDATKDDTAGIRIEIPAEKQQTTGKVTLAMDVYMPADVVSGFMINAVGNNKNQLSASISKSKIDQNLNKADGSYQGTAPIASGLALSAGWNQLTFVLDLDTETIDTYVNTDKMTTVDFRFKAQSESENWVDYAITAIQIIGGNGVKAPKQLCLDDIALYNYEKRPEAPQPEPARVFFEDFNGVDPADKALPSSIARQGNGYTKVDGTYSYVTESEGRRYLEIKDNSTNTDTAGILFSIPADKRQKSGQVTLEMDVHMPAESAHGFMINARQSGSLVRNQMSVSIQKSSINQNVSTPNGSGGYQTTSPSIAKNLTLDQGWHTLTFIMDLDTQTMDSYLDAEKLTTVDFRYKADALWHSVDMIEIIGCNNTAAPKLLQLDNIAVYTYAKIPAVQPSNTYLINKTFENDTVGSAPALGSVSTVAEANRGEGTGIWVTNAEELAGQGDRVPGGKENNTRFVKFSDFSINKANTTWTIPFTAQTGKIAVEYDLCIPTAKGENKNNAILTNINGTGQPGRGVALHQWQAKMQNYYNPDGGGTQTNVFSNDGTLKGDTWQHYKIIADYTTKRFSVEIDGTLYEDLHLRDNLPANLANLDKLTFAGATIDGDVSYERTMYVDNIKAYRVDQPPFVKQVRFIDKDGQDMDASALDLRVFSHIEVELITGLESEIDLETVTAQTVQISGAAYTKTLENNVLKLIPVLEGGQPYTLTLQGIEDAYGNSLPLYEASFQTAVEAYRLSYPNHADGTFRKGELVTGRLTAQQPAVAVMALYRDNLLMQAQTKQATAGQSVDCAITVPDDDGVYQIKLFAWDAMDGMQPVVLHPLLLTQAQ